MLEVAKGHVAQAGVFVVADVIFGVCALALAALEDLDVRVGLVGERGLEAMTVVVAEAQLRAGMRALAPHDWSSPAFVDTLRLGHLVWRGGCLSMPKISPYSKEFKDDAVRLLRTSGRSVPQLARELGVSPQSLRNWASQRDVDDGRAEGLTSNERDELRRLRREVKVLAEEREILKKAAAFFASESKTR